MPRFEESHDRFSKGRLSAAEAAEWLGVSERTFRRQRARYEEDGLCGLLDRRLGKVSPHRVPADEMERVLELYRTRYTGWTVKPFHERLVDKHGVTRSYGWTKSVLHAAGLVRPAVKRSAHRKKRPRRPVPGMMRHQDGSPHLWLPGLGRPVDLIVTMDDATSEIYLAFLVEEGTDSSFQSLLEVFQAKGLPVSGQGPAVHALHRPGQPLLSHPGGRGQGGQGHAHPGRPGAGPTRGRAHPGLLA